MIRLSDLLEIKHTLQAVVNKIDKELETKKYTLSPRSIRELRGVHPDIIKIVHRAIEITEQDYMVTDGLRSSKEQMQLVKKGVSKTRNSYHQYGLAVDLVAIDAQGKPSWDKRLYPAINRAVKQAQKELDLEILDNGFDLWKWDEAHWQMKSLEENEFSPRKFYAKHKGVGFI